MEDVTDTAFRRIICEYGKPDVTWTEFTSADGLLLADGKGKKKLLRKLSFGEGERPIVAQLFTSQCERMEHAAALCEQLGFDGIDINMGCPDNAVERQRCGAALIKYPEQAVALIRAAKSGAPRTPISVKTRAGYKNDSELEAWITTLLREEPAALTLHARTRKDMSKVPARWHLVAQVVSLRNALSPHTRVIGNGDALTLEDARQKAEASGADGVMLGRAIFGNPWLFSEHIPTPEERLRALEKHIRYFEEMMADVAAYAVMKKHFKAYITGWDGAKDLRAQLMETTNAREALALLAKAA